MAVLSTQDRADTLAELMRDGRCGSTGAVTKADVRAAVDALDDFMNTNATNINNAIPQPARGVLTQSQKALLLMLVIQKRYIRGS